MGNTFHIDVLPIEWRRAIENFVIKKKRRRNTKKLLSSVVCGVANGRGHTVFRMQLDSSKKLSLRTEIPLSDCIILAARISILPFAIRNGYIFRSNCIRANFGIIRRRTAHPEYHQSHSRGNERARLQCTHPIRIGSRVHNVNLMLWWPNSERIVSTVKCVFGDRWHRVPYIANSGCLLHVSVSVPLRIP